MNFCAAAMISSECASHSSDVSPQAVMPCPPRITPMAAGWSRLIAAMSRPSWNPGRRHGTHATRSPKHSRGQRLAVGGGRERDARVRVQVVDVRGLDKAVHRGVDGRRRAALAEHAVVERRDHLVLALDTRVDVRQVAQPASRSTARPASVSVPRSPPEPFTHSSSAGCPVTGSVAVPFAEAFPPA